MAIEVICPSCSPIGRLQVKPQPGTIRGGMPTCWRCGNVAPVRERARPAPTTGGEAR